MLTSLPIGSRALLGMIRAQPRTRSELMARTGLSRSAIARYLDALAEQGLITSADQLPSGGGRPPGLLSFNAGSGFVLAADLADGRAHLAVTDLASTVLYEREEAVDLASGPAAIVSWLSRRSQALCADAGCDAARVSAIAVGVPAFVDQRGGRIVDAPGLPGWAGFRLADALRAEYRVPAVVDSDVNLMAVGEQHLNWPDERDLIFVKVDSTIGAGLLVGGRLLRGASGSAGDIAHVQLEGREDIACVCGSYGCLAAIASTQALIRRLNDVGVQTSEKGEISAHVAAGNPQALVVTRDVGRALGTVLSGVINTINPSTVVLGGSVADIGHRLLAVVREEIYRRSRTSATQDLRVVFSRTWASAAVVGAGQMAVEKLLAPDPLDPDASTIIAADTIVRRR